MKTLFVLPTLLSILVFTHCKAAKLEVAGDMFSALKTKDLVSTQDVDRPPSAADNFTTIRWALMTLSLAFRRVSTILPATWTKRGINTLELLASATEEPPLLALLVWASPPFIWLHKNLRRLFTYSETTSDALWREVHDLINRRNILLIFHR